MIDAVEWYIIGGMVALIGLLLVVSPVARAIVVESITHPTKSSYVDRQGHVKRDDDFPQDAERL